MTGWAAGAGCGDADRSGRPLAPRVELILVGGAVGVPVLVGCADHGRRIGFGGRADIGENPHQAPGPIPIKRESAAADT
jgi:hypothetical protein